MRKTAPVRLVTENGLKPLVLAVILIISLIVGVAILSRPKAATTWKIMNAGDSIMQDGSGENFRSYLHAKLKAGGVSFNFVGKQHSYFNGSMEEEQTKPPAPDNGYAARGGLCLLANARAGCGFNPVEPVSNDNGILGMIQESWQAGYVPDAYTVIGGVNDRFCGCDVSVRYKEFIQALLVETPNAMVFYTTGVVWGEDYYSSQKPKLEAVASEFQSQGKKVYFVDAGSGLNASHYPSDNVHPNEAGYQIMAEAFYQVMKDKLGGSPTSEPTPTAPPTPSPTAPPTPTPTSVVTPTPTLPPTPTPVVDDVQKYDIQPNRLIDAADLSIVIRDYTRPGQTPVANSPADFDGNGKVDLLDLSNLIKRWGQAY